MRKLIFCALALPLLLLNSCGNGSKRQIITLSDVEFSYEGPLYEGPNPAQYAWKVDLKSLLKDQYQDGMKIKGAKLLTAEIRDEECEDCYGFDDIKSLVLSFATNNKDVPMQAVALLNPIAADKQVQALNISEEADLTDYLNESEVYIVLDSDLKQDIEANLTLKATITLELSFD
jgi:hypothetical protein